MRIQAVPIVTALAACSIATQAATAAKHERQLATPAPAPRPTVVSTIQMVDSRPTAVSTIQIVDSRPTAPAPTPSSSALPVLSANDDPQLESLLLAAVTWGASADTTSPSPTTQRDVPATTVFLTIFTAGAAVLAAQCHRTRKLRVPHLRPMLAAPVLAFCLLRVVACGLRIAWAMMPENEGLMFAVAVLLNLG